MDYSPIGTGYSANVRLELHVGDQIFELAEIAPDSVYLRKPVALPPSEAEVVMYVDGQRSVWQVDLPDGLSAASPTARTRPAASRLQAASNGTV
jgi:hypothetical protein